MLLFAENGYQSVLLAPTQVLANQHYETIKKRFDKFPVNVQVISRFNPASKNKLIIKQNEIKFK